jgi:hypothetical protein
MGKKRSHPIFFNQDQERDGFETCKVERTQCETKECIATDDEDEHIVNSPSKRPRGAPFSMLPLLAALQSVQSSSSDASYDALRSLLSVPMTRQVSSCAAFSSLAFLWKVGGSGVRHRRQGH